MKKNPLSEHITKARILQGPYQKVEKVLVDNGKKDKYFYDTQTVDDVLIGDVLLDNNIDCDTEATHNISYVWDYSSSYDNNLKEIIRKNSCIIRLRNDNIEEYNKVCNRLFQKFY